MAGVIHFEIMATEPTELATFYADVFGWETSTWEGPVEYHLLETGDGPGVDGAIMPRDGPAPDPDADEPMTGYVCTVGVDDLEAAMDAVVEHGGTVGDARDVPGVGRHAYARDPDGNQFGLMAETGGGE